MKLLNVLLCVCVLISCEFPKQRTIQRADFEVSIFGKKFSSLNVRSVEIENKSSSAKVKKFRLNLDQQENLLKDLTKLRKREAFKCEANYRVHLNFEHGAMTFLVCGAVIMNKSNETFYQDETGKNIVEEYLSK